MLKFILLVIAAVCIAAIPPLAIGVCAAFVLTVLWDDWKREHRD
jgi:hypothetical protein